MNEKIIKRIHYISLVAIILLIIPSGLNPFYFNIFFLVLGVNMINGGLGVYEPSKKTHIVPIICGVVAIGFGIYRLVF
ncbi:hypothetical protein CN384_07110 [Bacillus thuringiensis]|uniref:hypothetical protein n=1 Tax=Bacillus cereus group TaxID=86661 RepID=UPI000BF47066|nr:hypothetical protein [Bacillus thuringiensis]PEZ75280.1 hypothetical protein CN410_14490 [Bacillus anthracis]PFA29460.1 hypothetical protein CN384_07110 [Bacillus thuringiensis]